MDPAALLEALERRCPGQVVDVRAPLGEATAVVAPADLPAILGMCRDAPELGFDVLMDLTAVDYARYPGREDGPRFEVVYQLVSLGHGHRLRVKAQVGEDDPVVPSAVPLWPIADWLEREVWDMFGIRFAGHPRLQRLLMYEEFVGHPLRKDYPINRRQPLIGPRT